MWQEISLGTEFNFADFGFSGFGGKKNRELIWISDFTNGNNFSRKSCAVVVFVTLFATNFIEVQQCKKKE